MRISQSLTYSLLHNSETPCFCIFKLDISFRVRNIVRNLRETELTRGINKLAKVHRGRDFADRM